MKLGIPLPVRRVNLAEFSRLYLGSSTVASSERTISVRGRMPGASQDGLAEHVFLAMAKPADNLALSYPRSVKS
jgi:hypothetical protein